MSVRVEFSIKGINKAIEQINKIKDNLENAVVEGLLLSASEIKDKLNQIPEYQNKAEIFVSTPLKIYIGPSLDLVEEIKEMPEWTKYKGRKKCPWWHYVTYVLPEERLPVVGTAREEVQRVALEMRDRIRDIMVNKIKERIGVS